MISRKTPKADLENKRSAWRALGFVASLAFILIAISWTTFDVLERQALNFEADLLEDEEIPVSIITPPPPPPPPQQTTVIEIIDDDDEIEIELEIDDIELDEDTEIEIVEEDDDLGDDTPFMIVENMPAFGPCISKRGDERTQCTNNEIIRFVSKNTKYPSIAKDAGIQGKVYIYFVVGKDGYVKDVRILREVHPKLDAEAKRVIESLPRFEPGQQRGKSVSVQYTIPVSFLIR
jgi:protein TonB